MSAVRIKYGKTDVRYWRSRVTHRGRGKCAVVSENYYVRIQYGGTVEWFNLGTANKEVAAQKARDIYVCLLSDGWNATRIRHKPGVEKGPRSLTVGEYLELVHEYAGLAEPTFRNYCTRLRTVVGHITGRPGKIRGGRTYTGKKASPEWRSQIESTPLGELTAERVQRWAVKYVSERSPDPEKRVHARHTVNALIRGSRSLFGSRIRGMLPKDIRLPDPLPFSAVRLFKQGSMRYRSTLDPVKLLEDAKAELAGQEPEVFKALVLCLLLGLRRGEADMLRWESVRWESNVVRVERHEFFEPKCESSIGEVPADPGLMLLLRQWHANRKGDFVIESEAIPRLRRNCNDYRCDGHFRRLVTWLRCKGVTANSPVHTLRKECGRLVTERYGIFAASKMLRHAGIEITAKHYADDTRRFGTGLGDLLSAPETYGLQVVEAA